MKNERHCFDIKSALVWDDWSSRANGSPYSNPEWPIFPHD